MKKIGCLLVLVFFLLCIGITATIGYNYYKTQQMVEEAYDRSEDMINEASDSVDEAMDDIQEEIDDLY